MAQKQLLALNNKSASNFECVDITINDGMTITIDENSVKIKQKDANGRSKTCIFSKRNWFELINFTDIINSLFLLKFKNTAEHDTICHVAQQQHNRSHIIGNSVHRSGKK